MATASGLHLAKRCNSWAHDPGYIQPVLTPRVSAEAACVAHRGFDKELPTERRGSFDSIGDGVSGPIKDGGARVFTDSEEVRQCFLCRAAPRACFRCYEAVKNNLIMHHVSSPVMNHE